MLRSPMNHIIIEEETKDFICPLLSIVYTYGKNNKSIDGTLKVKYNFFLNIFNSSYNISFKSPCTDNCENVLNWKKELK